MNNFSEEVKLEMIYDKSVDKELIKMLDKKYNRILKHNICEIDKKKKKYSIDIGEVNSEADETITSLLYDLGFHKTVEAFNNIPKLY